MMRHSWPFVLIMLCASMACAWQGKCVGVADGDTIAVLHAKQAEKIRLHGVDCPEKTQAYGTRAKQFTAALVFGKVVTVDPVNTDRYGRTVARVKCPDGRSLNALLVQAGMAWWYRQYDPHNQTLAALEKQARAKQLGLWAEASPTPPWDYRRGAGVSSTPVPPGRPERLPPRNRWSDQPAPRNRSAPTLCTSPAANVFTAPGAG